MRKSLVAISLLLLGGCATTSAPLQPQVAMPQAYGEAAPVATQQLTLDWWQHFGSAELDRLIELALQDSPDYAIAGERVRQAEAQMRIVNASLFPVLSLGADTDRSSRRSEGSSRSQIRESTGASLSASYEIDLWGANRSAASASEFDLEATRFDHETARLTLVSGVADAYFELLSVRERLRIARENLEIAERVMRVVDVRARNGAVSQLDVARQQTAVLEQRAAIPPLEVRERQTLSALSILVGRPAGELQLNSDSLVALAVPQLAPGVPSELLVRRPDLASAEAQLAAANADIAIARAALLPRLDIGASISRSSDAMFSLSGPSTAWSIGASLLQPIFEGGRLRAGVRLAESRERELVEVYRRAILAALGDVEDALAASTRTARQYDLQAQVREQARRALRLAEVRYREGEDDLLSVLDAQRTLFQAEDRLAQVQLSRLNAAVSLYKALGGGWEAPARTAAVTD